MFEPTRVGWQVQEHILSLHSPRIATQIQHTNQKLTNEPNMFDNTRTHNDEFEQPILTTDGGCSDRDDRDDRDQDQQDGNTIIKQFNGPDIEIVGRSDTPKAPHPICDNCGLKLRDDNQGEVCMLCEDEDD